MTQYYFDRSTNTLKAIDGSNIVTYPMNIVYENQSGQDYVDTIGPVKAVLLNAENNNSKIAKVTATYDSTSDSFTLSQDEAN